MRRRTKFYNLILFFILITAFWLRWQFIQGINLYPDEFVTLLAMDMIQQKGAPVLPSGLFYDHGLLYSYLAAAAAFLGDAALWGRLTSLLFGLLTIALVYHFGQRFFSPAAGLLAATGLAFAPTAIQWSGRVRMYALLQFLVLLTIYLMLKGAFNRTPKASWGAVVAYFGALLTQFSAVALLPPIALAELYLQKAERDGDAKASSFRLRSLAVGAAVLIAFLLKRAGQPKGIAPLQAANPVSGIWQVLQIYGDFNLNLVESWRAIAPFFLQPPALIFSLFAVIAVIQSAKPVLSIAKVFKVQSAKLKAPKPQTLNQKPQTTLFLSIILVLTTLEMLILVAPDRRDDKYLFMLLPILLLLGARGMSLVLEWANGRIAHLRMGELVNGLMVLILVVGVGMYSQAGIADLLNDVGEDYRAAFAYVAKNRQPGDAVLTGTPAAAYYYLGRNDFYAVQAGGPYDYRILTNSRGELVERWLGTPWIHTLDGLNRTLRGQPVWLVLERWGLLVQYYQPFFMQNILAQTKFIREDNGVIVLKSLPDAQLLQELPAVPTDALLHGVEGDSGQLKLSGYTLEGNRLTLYWQAQSPLAFDYTVFINAQDENGQIVTQMDHRPLGSVYPTTLWPPGEIIRETAQLQLPPGKYHLRVGMYRLETGERLWVPGDETLQNMVNLGEIVVNE